LLDLGTAADPAAVPAGPQKLLNSAERALELEKLSPAAGQLDI